MTMDKLTSKAQRIFAGEIAASGILAQFGSLKAGLATYSSDPAVIQALSAWASGWAGALISGYLPTIQDLNAVYNVITREIAYYLQEGIPEYDGYQTYYIGDLVYDGTGTIYRSLIDSNTGQSYSNETKWLNQYSNKIRSIGNASVLLVGNTDHYMRWSLTDSTPTINYITLPSSSTFLKGRSLIFKNVIADSYDIKIRTYDSANINISIPSDTLAIPSITKNLPYSFVKFIHDGTNWWYL